MGDFGKLAVSLSLNSQGFANGVNRAAQQTQAFTRSINGMQGAAAKVQKTNSALNGFGDLLGKAGLSVPKIAPHLALVAVLKKQVDFFRESVELSKAAEDITRRRLVLEETLNKTTSGRGGQVIKDVHGLAYAAGEPKSGYEEAAKKLAAFGIKGDQIAASLQMLEKVAYAANMPLTDMADEYGRLQEKGELSLKKLQLLGSEGVPLLKALAETTHKTTTEIAKLADQGEITAAMVQRAFAKMAEPGSAMDKAFKEKASDLDAVAARAEADWNKFKKGFGDQFRKDFLEGPQKAYYEAKGSVGRFLNGGWAQKMSGALPYGMMGRGAPPVQASKPLRVPADLRSVTLDMEAGKRWFDLQQQGAAVVHSLRSPMEQYAAEVDRLKNLHDQGAISAGILNRALSKLEDPMKKLAGPVAKGFAKPWDQLQQAGQAIEQDMLTPLERYQNRMTELSDLLKRGALNQEFFDRAALRAKDDLAAAVGTNSTAGVRALGRGTQEAFSAIRKFNDKGDQPKDIKELVNQGKKQDANQLEQIRLQRQQNKLALIQF